MTQTIPNRREAESLRMTGRRQAVGRVLPDSGDHRDARAHHARTTEPDPKRPPATAGRERLGPVRHARAPCGAPPKRRG